MRLICVPWNLLIFILEKIGWMPKKDEPEEPPKRSVLLDNDKPDKHYL